MSYYSLISMMPKISDNLLLDDYPNAAVAYSLRQLRTAYTGAAIRVRRSSDNAEQDINFVSGDLDTQSLLDFVGYNQLTYSEDISQTAWTKTRATATANVTTAPDGLNTAGKYIEDLTLGEHGGARSASIINGITYNVSCYFKQAERTKIRFYSAISGSKSFDVDLTNGNVTNNTFVSTPIVTAVSNGFYRISITDTASSSTAAAVFSFRTFNASNQISYTGDGISGVYVWGAQLTQSSSVLPYEKTVADASRNGFITTWYDQSTNANNSTQATAASQAQIVSSGSLILDPDTGKISTLWSNDTYSIATSFAPVQENTQIAVFNKTALAQRIINLGSASSSPFIGQWNTSDVVQTNYGSTFTHGTSAATGIYIQTILRNSSNEAEAWHNNVAFPTIVNSNASNIFTHWGKSASPQSSGYKQELIYWEIDQSANRIAIETDINTYWDAY